MRIDARRLQLALGRLLQADYDTIRFLLVDLRPTGERPCRLQMGDDVRAVLRVQQIQTAFPRQGIAPLQRPGITQELLRLAAQITPLRYRKARLPRPDLIDQLVHVALGEEGPELSRRHGGHHRTEPLTR